MFRDLRYSLRSLLKRPGFTLVVIATLALGIGVNAALFSVFNLLLRPLPVKEPESIVRLSFEEGAGRTDRFSFPDYSYIRDHNQRFSETSFQITTSRCLAVARSSDAFSHLKRTVFQVVMPSSS